MQLPLSFSLMGAAWEPGALRDAVERVEAAIPDGSVPTLVLGNHDDHRLASRVGTAQTRVAAVLLCTLRGVPLLYQGDELGLRDVDVPQERRRDRFGRRGGGGRGTARGRRCS